MSRKARKVYRGNNFVQAPELNPNRSDTTMTPADVFAPNIAQSSIAEDAMQGKSMLYTPTISARKVGRRRPPTLPAFTMANWDVVSNNVKDREISTYSVEC